MQEVSELRRQRVRAATSSRSTASGWWSRSSADRSADQRLARSRPHARVNVDGARRSARSARRTSHDAGRTRRDRSGSSPAFTGASSARTRSAIRGPPESATSIRTRRRPRRRRRRAGDGGHLERRAGGHPRHPQAVGLEHGRGRRFDPRAPRGPEAHLPSGATVEVVRDDSGVIRTSVAGVKEHLIGGAILAALIVFLFLGNVRSTAHRGDLDRCPSSARSPPCGEGFTLNTITLLALALAVGIVIDDAIVVLENVFPSSTKGYAPREATLLATKEIGLAVLARPRCRSSPSPPGPRSSVASPAASSVSSATMAMSIAVSLFVAFTLTPMLTSRWFGQKVPGRRSRSAKARDGTSSSSDRARTWQCSASSSASAGWSSSRPAVRSVSCVPLAGIANRASSPSTTSPLRGDGAHAGGHEPPADVAHHGAHGPRVPHLARRRSVR